MSQHHHQSSSDKASRRVRILSNHLAVTALHDDTLNESISSQPTITCNPSLSFSPAEVSEPVLFNTKDMRTLLDGNTTEVRDWLFSLIQEGEVFNPVEKGGKVYVMPDYNQPMEKLRELTVRRIRWMRDRGVFKGWCTDERGVEAELRYSAMSEILRIYDHALGIKIGVHFFLWGGAIRLLGTKRHHDRWLKDTEDYKIIGSFAMTELGHGSNVRGIETVATYDSCTGEFVINTPCESAQKYWIGGVAIYATHTIVFAQLIINGTNQGIHAFVVQLRDANGKVCPNIRVADCGHKIGLNGVDNGRIWFDNVRIPREHMLNSVADVSPDGQYLSNIKDPEQRFAVFLSPLITGRVAIALAAVYATKVSLAIAIRYALTRRAFSIAPNGPEVLLLDYPIHQRRLLPLLAKTYAMNFAGNWLKMLYSTRNASSYKTLNIISCVFKTTFGWHNMRTLQECREACGGQGMKTENRIGLMKGEMDAQLTFEGDGNVLMQWMSKILLQEFEAAKKRNGRFQALGLEHMNESFPVLPSQVTSTILRSSQFQINAFRLRERDLLIRFDAEVSEYQAKGESKDYALVLAYQLAKDLSSAFTDRVILEKTIEQETNISDGSLKNVLGLVRSLYTMTCMEEDDAFLRYGYLSTQNAAAVRKEVAILCSELRPHALALVNSFGIPDSFLSPLANNWLQANSWVESNTNHFQVLQ